LQRNQADWRGDVRAPAEDVGGAFKQLLFSFGNLVGVQFELAAQLGRRAVFA